MTMTPQQVMIARQCLGLAPTSAKATKNEFATDNLDGITNQRWLEMVERGWADGREGIGGNVFFLTGRGIEQLKLQIGEFTFRQD